ncbi:phage holin family protein [Chroococcidiopsis sp. FACHB-1243]|uniref:phage holin family protein n=1 Tax=Chroococcidiopsis sp. [FACHB-1243] TaxID=2692781 RepID=UPI00177FCF13|nr:phage holin family protein [Chroococcidiopsis sp. [FACHB-1243]]MBD2306440.1 phage holin family protein [Chroococcidiopsis sp. [FACHB-1243]]
MLYFLLTWVAAALSLLITAYVVPGFEVNNFPHLEIDITTRRLMAPTVPACGGRVGLSLANLTFQRELRFNC